jgi:NitT/TauT family transport system substrate-binding protein
MMQRIFICLSLMVLLSTNACNKKQAPTETAGKVQLMLDWHPEPEFGGFYAAQSNGAFAKQGLNVDIKSAGEGAAMWQLVAQGKTEFGTTAADQVLIARAAGADVVAIFAVYQTSPQGVMVHKARQFTSLADVFNHPGTLEAEDDTWLHFCKKKFGTRDVKIISYAGGIGNFMAKPDDSQQCFITSEPLQANSAHGDPQTFLTADSGYNPYTTVVVCSGDTLKNKPALVKAVTSACREGWRAYLDDPTPANKIMGGLNHDMDAATFAAAAEAQKPLIETDETKKSSLGVMTSARWDELSKQLVDLNVLKAPIPAKDCFVDVNQLP